MKVGRIALLVGLSASSVPVLLVACGRPELPLTVQRTRSGHTEVILGDRVPVERVTARDLGGGRSGFYVLRTKYDFERFRADLPKPKALPPKEVQWGDEMMVAGYATGPDMEKLEIHTVVDTSAALHIYAMQYTAGEGCPPPQGGAGFDVVSLPLSEKPVTVHLDTDAGPVCKAGKPSAKAVCRLAQTATWLPQTTVPWQSEVECEVQTEPGERSIVDRSWFIGDLAKGSNAKITLSRAGSRITFPADALGRYTMKASTTDDLGRRAETTAIVDSLPANDETYVEFVWSNFTATDDIDTFPRLDTRIADVGAKGSTPITLCNKQGTKQPWCDVNSSQSVTVMKVSDTPGRYSVLVRYLDDRYKGMPVACVRVFRQRKVASEVCDDNPRRSGEAWEPGILLAAHGMFEGMMMLDAGAPEGGAGDGGTTDGGTKKAAPKAVATASDGGSKDASASKKAP